MIKEIKLTRKLPNKLSSLLAVALRDLQAYKRGTKRVAPGLVFEPYMRDWIVVEGNTCFACLAGCAVLGRIPNVKKTFKEIVKADEPGDVALYIGNFDADTANKMKALNGVRMGKIGYALKRLGHRRRRRADLNTRFVTDFDEDYDAWLKDMKLILKDLRKAGL